MGANVVHHLDFAKPGVIKARKLLYLNPRTRPEKDSHTEITDDTLNRIRGRHLRILVVDDSETFRTAIASELQDAYEASVEEADCAHSALAILAKKAHFEVILLDIRMPGMDGFEVCRSIQASRATGQIVLMSTEDTEEHRAIARGLAVPFISKLHIQSELVPILLECGGGIVS